MSFFCQTFAAQNQIEALNNIFREGELDKNSVHSILEYTFGDDLFLLLGGVSSIDPAFHAGFFLRISGRYYRPLSPCPLSSCCPLFGATSPELFSLLFAYFIFLLYLCSRKG